MTIQTSFPRLVTGLLDDWNEEVGTRLCNLWFGLFERSFVLPSRVPVRFRYLILPVHFRTLPDDLPFNSQANLQLGQLGWSAVARQCEAALWKKERIRQNHNSPLRRRKLYNATDGPPIPPPSQGIGDDQDVESSSANLVETEEGFQPVFFYPRRLKNLVPIDDIESLMPIMDFKVANFFDEETPQIYALCGRGNRSSLRILRPGLAVTEMAVSPLPGTPRAVWTVKKSVTDDFDSYIIVSFVNATLVLSIGETVEEVSDSGFLGTTPSLCASLLGDDSLMQVRGGCNFCPGRGSFLFEELIVSAFRSGLFS